MSLATLQPTASESRLEQLVRGYVERYGPDEGPAKLTKSLSEAEWNDVLFDWEWNSRERQTLPAGDWATCVWQAGRGWGKTRVGVEAIRGWAEQQEPYPMYLIAPTSDDVRSVMVEGESGILAKSRPDFRPDYFPSKRMLVWPNGVIAYTRSGDRPDRLRGPQGSKAWADEICAMRYGAQVRDQLDMMIRLGDPRVIYTTTPRPTKLYREICAEPDTVVIRGFTKENLRHLSEKFIARVYRKYAGTRMGKQELGGEVLDDNPGALWKMAWIDECRVRQAPELLRVVVSIDPSGGDNPESDEVGVGAAGVGWCSCKGAGKREKHGFVLDDVSAIMSPDEWAKAAAKLYHDREADRTIAEANFGGDMVESTLRTLGDPMISFKKVIASRGKKVRAEPIAALAEQYKIHHVGVFEKLEDELTQWDPQLETKSPNRLDWYVWAFSELMFAPGDPEYPKAFPSMKRRM